jgi:hypothetical protein
LREIAPATGSRGWRVRLSRKPDALGGAVEISGDDVPADAPAGQMIERRIRRQMLITFAG